MSKHVVTLIPGDGIGPEVVRGAVRLVEATGAPIVWEEHDAGRSVFERGIASGVPGDTVDSLARTKVALKGPLETPVGHGGKSANVTLRKLFETHANVRPARTLPGVPTPFSDRGIDLVVVRENVEDLYAGIEHMQTATVAQCLKLISRTGCERISHVALSLAASQGRSTVHCATKANIMKLTEGMLKRTFEDVAQEYPGIDAQHVIVDNAAHQLVIRPEVFEVIVTTNMNGDILSDLTSGLVGGLGFAPSANLGGEVAIFEAVHGSAPTLAGQDAANPTAVVLSAVMMLHHLGLTEEAEDIEHAVVITLADGAHTRDVRGANPVGTTAFVDAVLGHLGERRPGWTSRPYGGLRLDVPPATGQGVTRREVGADVFVEWAGTPAELAGMMERVLAGTPLRLKMISNRGTQVWPAAGTGTFCVDQFRCRTLLRDESGELADDALLDVLGTLSASARWMHVEKLVELDGDRGYTMAQGES